MSRRLKMNCVKCGTLVVSNTKFCSECGEAIAESDTEEQPALSYDIPKKGVAIEFQESAAATFQGALTRMKVAPINATCVRGKKRWYLAAWPEGLMANTATLAQELKGMRNKKVWIDSQEASWNEVFAFLPCSIKRNTSYKPVEYCLGIPNQRFNIWGCVQARMEWIMWARWFSYGRFEERAFPESVAVLPFSPFDNPVGFLFDKKKIRHELDTNLYRYRFCPHLRRDLVDAVLETLPDEVTVEKGGDWKLKVEFISNVV